MQTSGKSELWLKRAVFVAVLALAAFLTLVQLTRTQMLQEERVSLDAYMDGTVDRPFAYRVLVPATLNVIDAVTPQPVDEIFDKLGRQIAGIQFHFAGDPPELSLPRSSGSGQEHERAIVWLGLILWGGLAGYALLGAHVYGILFPGSRAQRLAAPFLLLIVAPLVADLVAHVYDSTVLLLMTALLWAMARERHITFLGLFALACLNKETAILGSMAWAIVFIGRMPWRRYIPLLAAQAAIFLAIYVGVRALAEGNPGNTFEYWLYRQADYYAAQPVAFFLLVAALLALFFYRFNEKPVLLQRASLAILPHLGLFLFAAFPGEFRNLYESVPLVSLILLRNVELLTGRWLLPRTRTAQP